MFHFLQYNDASCQFARKFGFVTEKDDVIINRLMVNITIHGSIPLEIFAVGTENECSPSVIDVNAEIVITNQFKM